MPPPLSRRRALGQLLWVRKGPKAGRPPGRQAAWRLEASGRDGSFDFIG
jgi:hypothetical protein